MGVFKAGLLILFALALILPVAKANIGELDEVWQKRGEEAKKAARDSYHPNPIEVVSHLNYHVHTASSQTKDEGPCQATNPIDKCWRCDKNWANNRKKLADCVLGFGRGVTGGKDGEFYEVTDPSDNDLVDPKPGTLRFGVIQDKPLWITFARDMVIKLKEELMITDNKTIDGRGAVVSIENGAQITMQLVKNIIIHGLTIRGSKAGSGGIIRDSVHHHGKRGASDGDAISLFAASRIWIDHVSMTNCADGLIDAVMGSTAITISNCHMFRQNHVFLFGASDSHTEDAIMQVTVAFNRFDEGLVQRLPNVRFGFAHIVNNDYIHWGMYAIGGSKNPTILSQGNRFLASPNQNTKEVTKRQSTPESEWKKWNWRSENDLLLNGAIFVESGSPISNVNKQDLIEAKPGTEVESLTRSAGALKCVVGQPC